VRAAIEVAVGFYTMADYLDITVLAGRSEGVDRALEAVEGMRVPIGRAYLKGLIVLVSADLALGHIHLLLPGAERFPVPKIDTRDLAGTNARLDGARSLPRSLLHDKIPATERRRGASSDF
jgi:hypothetical protein